MVSRKFLSKATDLTTRFLLYETEMLEDFLVYSILSEGYLLGLKLMLWRSV